MEEPLASIVQLQKQQQEQQQELQKQLLQQQLQQQQLLELYSKNPKNEFNTPCLEDTKGRLQGRIPPPDVMERAARKVVNEKKSLRDVAKDFEVGFRLIRGEVTGIPYTNLLRC